MEGPKELSLNEIRKYMLDNGCKVTNHSLVKHFKRFLTHPDTQIEARKEFKTYVNILATIKNENNQKYLILRKKYLNECPSEDVVQRAISQAGGGGSEAVPSSPGGVSLTSDEAMASPLRKPPPYIPPPEVSTTPTVAMYEGTPLAPMVEITHATEDDDTIKTQSEGPADNIDGQKLEAKANEEKSVSRVNSVDETANKENIPRFSFSSGSSATDSTDMGNGTGDKSSDSENPISVKEATRKFNRMASEEEAKIISPPTKKKPEKLIEEKELPEVTLAHPKAKEWIVAMAKASYQELAKLATDHPELVKLQDPSTGYTALHWGAKHGNEDVIKLIAGTYKANVNATTNGGYTPLHIAMQFGRVNVFALLCNTYKANRDLLDWAGNKALDYSKQQTSVSASTYSKIKAKRKPTVEKDLGFLRIGSLNVRVKKTTEAFSNFLGVGNGNGSSMPSHHHPPHAVSTASLPHQRPHRHHHYPHHLHHVGTTRNQHHLHPMMMKKSSTTMITKKNMHHLQPGSRASAPINSKQFDMLHKSWGSADNITRNGSSNSVRHHHHDNDDESLMPPPKDLDSVKKRQKNAKRSSISSNATDSPRDSLSSTASSNFNSGYSSMPTTPNQLRSPLGLVGVAHNLNGDSDSDSACGFDSNWSINGREFPK
uniref:SOWAHA-C winged helix-turn-helix domain-containing protein n=1 Tax=Stomoxys calcitrans TaxID=35570 RepID=A0A1I8Q934_STOCA